MEPRRGANSSEKTLPNDAANGLTELVLPVSLATQTAKEVLRERAKLDGSGKTPHQEKSSGDSASPVHVLRGASSNSFPYSAETRSMSVRNPVMLVQRGPDGSIVETSLRKSPEAKQSILGEAPLIQLGQKISPARPAELNSNFLLARPENMPTSETNALLETWLRMHQRAPGADNLKQEEWVASEVRSYAASLGMQTFLHKGLNDTLVELAVQTRCTLEEQGAQLTEAEYLYLVTETLIAWKKAWPDAEEIRKVDASPALVLSEALDYIYRPEMANAYGAAAERALPELLKAGGNSERREQVLQKYCQFGDPEVFRKQILVLERRFLEEAKTALTNELGQELCSRLKNTFKTLESGTPSQVTARFRELERSYQPRPELRKRLEDLTAQLKLNHEDSGRLWADLLPSGDRRREQGAPPETAKGVLTECLRKEGTRILLIQVEKLFSTSRESDIAKRYGEWSGLAAMNAGLPGGLSEQQSTKLQSFRAALSRVSHCEQVEKRFFDLIANDEARIASLKTEEKIGLHQLGFDGLSGGQRSALAFCFAKLAPMKASTMAKTLSREEANKILAAFDAEGDLRSAVLACPQLLPKLERYLGLSGIDPSPLRQAFLEKLRLTPGEFSSDMNRMLQLKEPLYPIWERTRVAAAALSPKEYQVLLSTIRIPEGLAKEDGRYLNACLQGSIPKEGLIQARLHRRLEELANRPDQLRSFVGELRPLILKHEPLLHDALAACRKAGLMELARSLIAERRAGAEIPPLPEGTQRERAERFEKLRQTLLPADEQEREKMRGLPREIRQYYLQAFESAIIREEHRPARETQPAPDLKSADIPPGLDASLRMTTDVKDDVAEILRLATVFGRTMPLEGQFNDSWGLEYRKIATEEYHARVQPLYEKILAAEKKHGVLIDLEKIRAAERICLTRAELAACLECDPGTRVNLEHAGVTKVLSQEEIASSVLLAKLKPIAEQILQAETLLAAAERRAARVEMGPKELVDLQLQITAGRKSLERLYARLEAASYGSELDVSKYRTSCRDIALRAAVGAEQPNERVKRLTELSTFVKESELPLKPLIEELKKRGALEALGPDEIRRFVLSARGFESFRELQDLYQTRGFLLFPANGKGLEKAVQALAKTDERIAVLEKRLSLATADFPEYFTKDENLSSRSAAHRRGNGLWLQEVRRSRERAAAIEAKKNGLERAIDILDDGTEAAGRLIHSIELTGGATAAQFAGFVRGAATLENPVERAVDYGADYIAWSHKKQNKYGRGGSALGSDEQLANSSLFKLGLQMTPLGEFGDATIKPLLGLTELAFDETSRLAYNATNGTKHNYQSFQQIQANDPALKNLKRVYHGGEIVVSLLVISGTGGAGAVATGSRLSRATRAFDVAAGISLATATGEEFLNHTPEEFSAVRVLDRAWKGTSDSLKFSGTLTLATGAYVKLRMGKDMPMKPADLQKLQAAHPEKYAQYLSVSAQARRFGQAIDFGDSQGDLVDAMANFEKVKTAEQLMGAMLILGGALRDATDWKSGGGARHLDVNNRAEDAIKVYRGRGVEGTLPADSLSASLDGSTVYVADPEVLRDLFIAARREEIKKAGKDPAASSAETEEEAKHVRAFTDRTLGVIVVSTANLETASEAERLLAASWIDHENMHAAGFGEFEAYRAQLDRLQERLAERGLAVQVELKDGEILLRDLPAGTRAERVTDSAIAGHIGKLYGDLADSNAILAAKAVQRPAPVLPDSRNAQQETLVSDTLWRLERRDKISADTVISYLSELTQKSLMLTKEEAARLETVLVRWDVDSSYSAKELLAIQEAASAYVSRESAANEYLNTKVPRPSPEATLDWFYENLETVVRCLAPTPPSLVHDETLQTKIQQTRSYWERVIENVQIRLVHQRDIWQPAPSHFFGIGEAVLRETFGFQLFRPQSVDLRSDEVLEALARKQTLPSNIALSIEERTLYSEASGREKLEVMKGLMQAGSISFIQHNLNWIMRNMTAEEKIQCFEILGTANRLSFSFANIHVEGLTAEQRLQCLRNLCRCRDLELTECNLSSMTAGMTVQQRLRVFDYLSELHSVQLSFQDIDSMTEGMSAAQRLQVFDRLGQIACLTIIADGSYACGMGHMHDGELNVEQRVQAIRSLMKSKVLSLPNMSHLIEDLSQNQRLQIIHGMQGLISYNEGLSNLLRDLLGPLDPKSFVKALGYLKNIQDLTANGNYLFNRIENLPSPERSEGHSLLGKMRGLHYAGFFHDTDTMTREERTQLYEMWGNSGYLNLDGQYFEFRGMDAEEIVEMFEALEKARNLHLRNVDFFAASLGLRRQKDLDLIDRLRRRFPAEEVADIRLGR